MKKYIYILLISVGLLQSCSLDTEPTDALKEEVVLESVRNAGYVLNGSWAYLMDTYVTYQNPGFSSILLSSDAMSSDVAVLTNRYGYGIHYSFTGMSNASSTPSRGIWTFLYTTINNTNIILSQIDNVPADGKVGNNETTRQEIKGQAYALRGFLYLNLVTFYGHSYQYDPNAKCVPIYTEPSNLTTEGKPKSTVSELYKRAEEDLLEAYTLLDKFNRGGIDKHRMDKQVVSGALARLYMQRMDGDDWKNALKYAKEAQIESEWMTKASYLTGFNDRTNNEWIWGHGQATDQNVASYSFNYKDVSSAASGYYSFMADPYFLDLFKNNQGVVDADDVRSELFQWDLERVKGALMFKKFRYRIDKTADIVLMRKGEMVLIEAEALAELSDLGEAALSEAISKLNELRDARGAMLLDASEITGKDQLIDIIMIERRKELFGEGFGLSDIKRRQGTVVRKEVKDKTPVPGFVPGENEKPIYIQGHEVRRFPDGKAFTPNSSYYNFIIPTLETTNNPNLNK